MFQKAVSSGQAYRAAVDEGSAKLRNSVPASRALVAELAEFDKLLKTSRAKMVSHKEQVARADTEKAESDKMITHVREVPEQHRVRLEVVLVGRTLCGEGSALLSDGSSKNRGCC